MAGLVRAEGKAAAVAAGPRELGRHLHHHHHALAEVHYNGGVGARQTGKRSTTHRGTIGMSKCYKRHGGNHRRHENAREVNRHKDPKHPGYECEGFARSTKNKCHLDKADMWAEQRGGCSPPADPLDGNPVSWIWQEPKHRQCGKSPRHEGATKRGTPQRTIATESLANEEGHVHDWRADVAENRQGISGSLLVWMLPTKTRHERHPNLRWRQAGLAQHRQSRPSTGEKIGTHLQGPQQGESYWLSTRRHRRTKGRSMTKQIKQKAPTSEQRQARPDNTGRSWSPQPLQTEGRH